MYLYSIFRHDESSFRIPCVNLGLASSSALLELLGESHGENFWTDKMIFRMKKWWCFLIFLLVSVGRWLDDWIRLKGFGISWELLVRFAVIWLPTGQNLILPSWTNPIYICWPMLIRTFTYPVWLLLDIDPSSYPNFWMSTDFARFPTKKWWIMMYHLSQMWIAVYIHGGWLLQPLFFKSNLLIQLQFPQDSIHGNNGEFLPLIMPFSWNQNCFLCWNFLTNPGWSLTPGVFSVGYSLRLI